MRRTSIWLAGALATACGSEDGQLPRPRLEVNLQVTGADNIEPMMNALDARGMVATIWLSDAEIDDHCTLIRTYAATGHEVAGKSPTQIRPDTSEAEQRARMSAVLTAAENCGLPAPRGFRATRFTANDATGPLLDELGYAYLERSARDEFLSVFTFEPHEASDGEYAILPMPIRVAFGNVGSLCDTSASGDLSPEQFFRYVQAALRSHLTHRGPLILEWHPSLTHPGNAEGWWPAFISTLEALEAHRADVEYVTAVELVGRRGLAGRNELPR